MDTLNSIMAQIRADRKARRESPDKPLSRSMQRRLKVQKKQEEDRELEAVHARAKAQARYHEKNREHLNRGRALRARLPKSVYCRAERRARERGQEWEFTFEEWWDMWENAPTVLDERTGWMRTAWSMKGGDYRNDTQMMRRDVYGPWNLSNCYIGRNGEPIDGNDPV